MSDREQQVMSAGGRQEEREQQMQTGFRDVKSREGTGQAWVKEPEAKPGEVWTEEPGKAESRSWTEESGKKENRSWAEEPGKAENRSWREEPGKAGSRSGAEKSMEGHGDTWSETPGEIRRENQENSRSACVVPVGIAVPGSSAAEDTPETKRMKENFRFFGFGTFLYAVFYAICMIHNDAGIAFPFFVAGSLLYLYYSLSKLGLTLKKGSSFYMGAMLLLGVSTFCTDDDRIIIFNKLGIFLLMMSLLLKQYYDTDRWQIGKFLGSIFMLTFGSIGEIGQPFKDVKVYRKSQKGKSDGKVWGLGIGLLVGIPLLLVVLMLLSSADAVFRQMTDALWETINLGNIMNLLFRIVFLFLASYGLTAYLCRRKIREAVPDRRRGDPVAAITVTGLLTVLYVLFSGIQIVGLFLGKLELPAGYTYAMYAREGFFQLLLVSLLNLVIALVCMSYFGESRILKGILTVMSLCTFVMIASSAMRMLIYIHFYYLTFLRILVLWALAVLFLLFAGVVVSICRKDFPLFRYSMTVVTVLYLALSFAHPDYLIARVNVANAQSAAVEGQAGQSQESRWTRAGGRSGYSDYWYLSNLSADAAPVLIPYLRELGYDLTVFDQENAFRYAMDQGMSLDRDEPESFGYYWMRRLQTRTENLGIRTFNLSRYLAVLGMK